MAHQTVTLSQDNARSTVQLQNNNKITQKQGTLYLNWRMCVTQNCSKRKHVQASLTQ